MVWRGPASPRGYNRVVPSVPLNQDTSREIERIQVEGWRRMSADRKAALVTGLTRAAVTMTLAGIRHRHPGASPREQQLRLALITLGPELARKAFPEIDALDER
jgi:hypothetical protein